MTAGEVLIWLLFVALLVPAGVVGWAIGHYTRESRSATRTVTVTAAGSTTPAATTTAGATTSAAVTTSAAATTAPATTSEAATTGASTSTGAAAAAGNAAAGKAVFAANGCASCHAFKPAGSNGTIGPDLDTRPATDAKKAKMELAAFLRESIVSPNSFVAAGYPKGVMPQTFGGSLSKAQLDNLVAFLLSGAPPGP